MTAKSSKKSAAPKKKATAPPKPAAAERAKQSHVKAVERMTDKAEQQHKDPRGAAKQSNPAPEGHGLGARSDPGAVKGRGVPRLDRIVNWFRRGQGR